MPDIPSIQIRNCFLSLQTVCTYFGPYSLWHLLPVVNGSQVRQKNGGPPCLLVPEVPEAGVSVPLIEAVQLDHEEKLRRKLHEK